MVSNNRNRSFCLFLFFNIRVSDEGVWVELLTSTNHIRAPEFKVISFNNDRKNPIFLTVFSKELMECFGDVLSITHRKMRFNWSRATHYLILDALRKKDSNQPDRKKMCCYFGQFWSWFQSPLSQATKTVTRCSLQNSCYFGYYQPRCLLPAHYWTLRAALRILRKRKSPAASNASPSITILKLSPPTNIRKRHQMTFR